MASPSTQTIIDRIAAAGKALEAGEPGARSQLVDLGRALMLGAELPSEFIQRSLWAEPALAGICRIFVETKAFQHLAGAGDAGLSSADLAARTGIEQKLLERFLRHLSAMCLLAPVGGAANTWRGTELSNQLAEHKYDRSLEFCYDVGGPSFAAWPAFFKKNGYRTPASATEGPLNFAHATDLPFFAFLSATPSHLANFSAFMTAYRAGHPEWHQADFYPVAERLMAGYDAAVSDVLLVDVGGSVGHDLVAFAAHFPDHPGRLVLQDREPVIESIQGGGDDGPARRPFEATVHDFFTPQPVRAARAYYLHSVLHDWDDVQGVRILENLRPAMRAGYSRLLLCEIVLTQERPALAATNMDIQMLAYLGGDVHERTEAEWRGMLAQAGFKVTQIYSFPGSAESIIEAEVA